MSATITRNRLTASTKEAVLAGAVDLARSAAIEVAGEHAVGEHQGVIVDGERLLTHVFASTAPGYRGWCWAVTLARPPRGRRATVCEVEQLPGEDAVLAPEWVPWADRLSPEDVGPGDVLPYIEDDARLEQGYEVTSEEDADLLGTDLLFEIGLGRDRVLSAEGRRQALTRWYDSRGPEAPEAKAAKSQCSTCGFFLKLAGSPRRLFGVCANEWSPADGQVVSVDHGCGAHSESHGPRPASLWQPTDPVVSEPSLEVISTEPLKPAGDATHGDAANGGAIHSDADADADADAAAPAAEAGDAPPQE